MKIININRFLAKNEMRLINYIVENENLSFQQKLVLEKSFLNVRKTLKANEGRD